EKAINAAQQTGEGGGGATAPPPPPGGEEQPTPKGPAGDLNHTPPGEQVVNTPVPIYVELPSDIEASKLMLHYKPFGGTKFKSLEMKPHSKGFAAEIPCDD